MAVSSVSPQISGFLTCNQIAYHLFNVLANAAVESAGVLATLEGFRYYCGKQEVINLLMEVLPSNFIVNKINSHLTDILR